MAVHSSETERGELYISVDVETAGPIPGTYSMLALGACGVQAPDHSFYTLLRPINDQFVPAAMQVSGFSLDQLRATGRDPAEAMRAFQMWLLEVAGSRRPVFVGFNASFDWSFVNWYFHTFLGENPFGIGGIDIKSYYMGMTGRLWSDTSSSRLPPEFQPTQRQAHHALDDALAQAEIFAKMVEAARDK